MLDDQKKVEGTEKWSHVFIYVVIDIHLSFILSQLELSY